MNLCHRLNEYVRACFTGIWIESHEHQDALTEIAGLCRDQQWQLATWDIETGLTIPGQSETDAASSDQLAAIRSINSLATPDGTAVLVLQNFHRFMQSAEIVQALSRQIIAGKQNRTIVVVLSPVVQIPTELEKMFVVIEHDLPSREQLAEIARGIATEDGELPAGSELETVLDAASGLTRMEAENAFSLSLIREDRITADAVWEIKTQTLKKSGLLSLHRGTEDFSSLGGLSALKAFCKRAMLHPSRGNPLKRPRGVLLLSPPGCGKSQFCKLLGNEVGRPVLTLDVGSLMGSLVGQSEERTRQALRVIDAMAPCLAMIDEVEKAFAGLNGSGDSGVSSRMFGQFLSWLNDHESDVFVVCTANDVSKLPPEFGRSERFDGIFFLDLPSREEKDAIWNLYLDLFEIGRDQRLPDDTNWTGAEVKACCRLSALLDVPLLQAAQNVVPVAVTAAESVERLRTWANGRCLSANESGIYRGPDDLPKSKSRRNVSRDPSHN
ncbi:MAG TPA: AAA family ATPase [Planctomycetaceae bacterium]|nr:AAA family ATPase [Planctomycetaceae bacterium]